jgi:hypothetical protein
MWRLHRKTPLIRGEASSARVAVADGIAPRRLPLRLLITNYVDRVEPFRAFLAFKIYRVALVERLKSILLDRREMDKNIFAGRALNESIALGPVKPLYDTTFSHKYSLSCIIFRIVGGEGKGS